MTDYKRPVMELIAHNISNFSEQHPQNKCLVTHSELDWYFAQDDSFLKSLEVLDHNMDPTQGTFHDFALKTDVIIGSDLLYFPDSVQPLFEMVFKLFEISENKDLVFYMCMIKRGKEIHDALDSYILENQNRMSFKVTDQEFISKAAEEFKGQGCTLYEIRKV